MRAANIQVEAVVIPGDDNVARRYARSEAKRVDIRKQAGIVDLINTVTEVKEIIIVSGATLQIIGTGAAAQHIVAGAAIHAIDARQGGDRIGPGCAPERIVAFRAGCSGCKDVEKCPVPYRSVRKLHAVEPPVRLVEPILQDDAVPGSADRERQAFPVEIG